MNNRSLFYLVCLVAVMMLGVWGNAQDIWAQSQSDLATSQAEQGGESTLNKPTETSVLKTQKDQVNYAIGVNLIGNIKKQGVDVDLKLVMKGMQDAFSGEKLLLSEDELQKALTQHLREVRRMQGKIITLAAADNKKAGETFLAENKKKEGVVTLPSGLQYQIVKSGDGKKPIDGDTVECRYRGTFINGKEFDSSYRIGRPVELKVNSVISGWKEAFKLMPVGSIWKIFVPSQLAYGERGASDVIGPNVTLIFEVELLAIK